MSKGASDVIKIFSYDYCTNIMQNKVMSK